VFVLISKVFSIFLAAIAISKSYVDFRARKESLQMFVVWTFTWFSIVIVAIAPGIIDYLFSLGGGRTGIGTFLGMAMVFLFFLLYRVYVKLERLDQKMTGIIQELALRENWRREKRG
jgi:small membrane protein